MSRMGSLCRGLRSWHARRRVLPGSASPVGASCPPRASLACPPDLPGALLLARDPPTHVCRYAARIGLDNGKLRAIGCDVHVTVDVSEWQLKGDCARTVRVDRITHKDIAKLRDCAVDADRRLMCSCAVSVKNINLGASE